MLNSVDVAPRHRATNATATSATATKDIVGSSKNTKQKQNEMSNSQGSCLISLYMFTGPIQFVVLENRLPACDRKRLDSDLRDCRRSIRSNHTSNLDEQASMYHLPASNPSTSPKSTRTRSSAPRTRDSPQQERIRRSCSQTTSDYFLARLSPCGDARPKQETAAAADSRSPDTHQFPRQCP